MSTSLKVDKELLTEKWVYASLSHKGTLAICANDAQIVQFMI